MDARELLAIIERAEREGWTELDLVRTEVREFLERTSLSRIPGRFRVGGIEVLPEEIGRLTRLERLHLAGHQLGELPKAIGQLSELRYLDLRDNYLAELPEAISQLSNLRELRLQWNLLTELPKVFGQISNLQSLVLEHNLLAELPEAVGQLGNLQSLNLGYNRLVELSETIGQLGSLQSLDLENNRLSKLPEAIGQLANLQELNLKRNQLTEIPEAISQLSSLQSLNLVSNQLTSLAEAIGQLSSLRVLGLQFNQLTELAEGVGQLLSLQELNATRNQLTELPRTIGQLSNLQSLNLGSNRLTKLPDTIGQLSNLQSLVLRGNQLVSVPATIAILPNLSQLDLHDNPLGPGLKSAYIAGSEELTAYLRSLAEAEPLYEAKLVLVGEGGVGKTTLLKALMGQNPRAGEATTHGVEIHALPLPHPDDAGVQFAFKAWDFGGQEVYRPTHQFFFSPRAVYLLVWEPRRGVQQCQVEDWIKMIRLRVGDEARVIVVSTHCRTGERLARIDKVVMERDYGQMIAGFCEVDSLVADEASGEMVGVAALKAMIAEAAAELEGMGMPINPHWLAARDDLLARPEAHIGYEAFAETCGSHGLQSIDTRTLAIQMRDLGHIVYYPDDERLKDDVVLKPEWLTKAIGFVLEDGTTREMDGILPDSRLAQVWRDHKFADEPRYEPDLYPFFLGLMEKFDVSYRLESGDGSLVAQHVPQVRPALPWKPEEEVAEGQNRIGMVCVMEEAPPGIVPWMIVRTHDYAVEEENTAGEVHRLHWQRGMFLKYPPHGTAYLEFRRRQFHVQVEAEFPPYFMSVLQHTLDKLITDNWPGLEDRYWFGVPCPEKKDGRGCEGRFDIGALRQFLAEGDTRIRCQACRSKQSIHELLLGLGPPDWVRDVREEIQGLESRSALRYMRLLAAMADEAKWGPRLFTLQVLGGERRKVLTNPYRLRLYCEADGLQHPVTPQGKGPGVYDFDAKREWVEKVEPAAAVAAGLLKMVGAAVGPAAVLAGSGAAVAAGTALDAGLDLTKPAAEILSTGAEVAGRVKMEADEAERLRTAALSERERAGLLALHEMLRELDPHQEEMGLLRMPTYTGEYRWLCSAHWRAAQSVIPERFG